jgi:hypothetical protein
MQAISNLTIALVLNPNGTALSVSPQNRGQKQKRGGASEFTVSDRLMNTKSPKPTTRDDGRMRTPRLEILDQRIDGHQPGFVRMMSSWTYIPIGLM